MHSVHGVDSLPDVVHGLSCTQARHETEESWNAPHDYSNTYKQIVATYNVLLGIHALRHLTVYIEVHARINLAQMTQTMYQEVFET